MPTREAIVDNIIPREVEKPIPVRTVSTRSIARPQPNINQPGSIVEPRPEESANPAESVKLSPQLSALARKEQAYRQREQALKDREKALEAKLLEADQYSQLKTKISSKDFSAAEELGLSYDEYTKYKLDRVNSEDPTQQAMKKLEEEIQALKKGQEEKATKEYEETVAAYRKELASLADSKPEFAKVKAFKEMGSDGKEFTGVDVATQYIVDSWNEDGEEVSIEEALKLTSEFIREKAKQWALLLDEEVPQVVDEPKALPQPKVQTLTQHMQPSGIEKKPAKSLQHLPENERYEEARRRVIARMQQDGR